MVNLIEFLTKMWWQLCTEMVQILLNQFNFYVLMVRKTQLWIMLQLICTVLDTRLDISITKYILPFHLHKSSACHRFSMAQKQGVGILESSDCACSVFLFPIGFPFWHCCQTRRRWNKRFNYMLLLCCVIYRLLVIKSVRTSTFRFL